MLMGDFNAILEVEDRIGDKACCQPSLEFIQCTQQCGLEDIPYSGNRYTWCNKRLGRDRISSKIDRVLANGVWMDCFEKAEAVFFE